MTHKTLSLKLDFCSYWHPGTGKGSGSHVDAVVEKDRYGCPYISGRMLKGVLRDAVFRGLTWGLFPLDGCGLLKDQVIEKLFGSSAYEEEEKGKPFPREATLPGLIRVGDAVMVENLRKWLNLKKNEPYRQELFRDLYQTAIQNGVAKPKSLRGQQVVVPLTLKAKLGFMKEQEEMDADANSSSEWVYKNSDKIVEKFLPLIPAIGAYRTRGLGRVQITREEVNQ